MKKWFIFIVIVVIFSYWYKHDHAGLMHVLNNLKNIKLPKTKSKG